MAGRRQSLRELVALSGLGADEGAGAPVLDERVLQAALAEQVAPLLGARVAAGELGASGPGASGLVRAHLACVATEAWAAAARAPLLEALRARDIPVMLLKGGALVATVYRGAGRRLMADLDVLVPRGSWREAQRALVDAGAGAMSAEALVVRLRLNHERAFRSPAGALLDLHQALAPWPLFAVDHPGLFARARAIEGGLLVPAAEDLFVSLALHAAQDGFALPLRSVLDGLALARAGVEPSRVTARARAWGAARATATLLHMLLGLGLPAEVWAETAAHLDPDGAARRAAAGLPRPVPADTATGTSERWSARWRLLLAHDSRARPVVFFAYRAALRAGDRWWGAGAR